LGAHTTRRRTFTQDDINFLQAIANILATAIERSEREARLRLLERAINASSNGILISDPNQPDHPIIFVNSGFEKLTGYSAEETLGRNCRFLQGSETRQPALEELRSAIREARECRVTMRNYRKDGRLFWNEFYISPVRNNQGELTHFIGIQTDVTAQKLVEEILQKQAQLLDLANDAIIVRDLNGQISYWNQGAERLYGWTAEEAVGKNSHSLLLTEFPQALTEIQARLLYWGYWQGELIHRKRDGTKITIATRWTLQRDEQGKPSAILQMNDDITERKRQEKQLKFQANVLSHVSDVVIAVDNQDRVTYWNETAEKLYHFTANEAIDQKLETLYQHCWLNPEDERVAHESLKTRGVWLGENIHINRNGERIYVESSVSVLTDDRGAPVGLLAVIRDITHTHQAHQRLRESEKCFSKMFYANPLASMMSRLSDGCIAEVNDRFLELFGYNREEVINRTSLELGMFANPAQRAQLLQALSESGTIRDFELQIQRKSGERRDVLLSVERIELMAELYLLSMLIDITERKRAETALVESEERFRRAIVDAPIPIAIHSENDGNGAVIQVNKAWTELTGYTAKDIPTIADWCQKAYGERHKSIKLWINQLYDLNTRVDEGEFEVRISSGETRIWTFSSAPLGKLPDGRRLVISMATDITERKQVEIALRQSIARLENLRAIDKAILAAHSPQATAQAALERLRQLLPCARLSVVVFDFETRKATIIATHSNSETQIKTGTDLSLELFSSVLSQLRQGEIYYQTQLETLPQSLPIVQAFQAEGLSYFLGFPLIAQQELMGTLKVWVNPLEPLTAEQIASAQEVADQLAIAVQQYRLQQQLVQYTSQLEERVAERTLELQDSNAELEAFAYSVSHDLRAPLRGMQGFANALLEDCAEQLGDLGQEYAQRIISAAQRMDRMIQDLLAYSRLTRAELRLKPVSLASVVTEVHDHLEEVIKETKAQITVGAKGWMPLPAILGHRATLIQVVSNLLANAIKFVPSGVRPQVDLWAEERPDVNGRVWVRLWVEDNGIGIKPEYQEKIFRVFERLHGYESYPGSGIGLAIVRKGMERMGGRSGLESSINRGSRFWIEGYKALEETTHEPKTL
jgi:PAS domain S-box-containing protein